MPLKKDQFLIVYAVLAAAIVVSGIALVPIAIEALKPQKDVPTPVGSFGEVVVKSRYEIQVHLGNCTPLTNYSECRIIVTSPANDKASIDLYEDKYVYSMAGVMSRLTEVRISDTQGIGLVGDEDYITLYHSYPLLLGVWNVELAYKASDKAIASRPVVAPDTSSHPVGDFLSGAKVNQAKYRLVVGIVSPPTDYAYCRLMVDAPGTTDELMPKYFNLTEAKNQAFYYGSQVRVTLSAQNEYGLPQSGDTIELTSTGASLPFGQWTVALVYKYDGGRIAVKVFSMTA